MPLKPIETKRLYQQVADQVAELIRQVEWKPGDRLPPEREMANKLGVSRPTVREAMIALELRGLIEVRTGSGIYVKMPADISSIKVVEFEDPGPSPFEIIDARRLIEGETIVLAIEKMTSACLENLEAAIKKMESDIDAGLQDVASQEDGDWLFHIRIAEAAGNTVLRSIVDQLWEGMRHPMFRTIGERVRLPANARRAVRDHRVILEHIIKGDKKGARNAMHMHMDQVKSYLLKDESI
jgi:GntR family transcriptional repressor for pyruvate dehydrogenase complex